jgi:DNA polymerase-3 subunit alpha
MSLHQHSCFSSLDGWSTVNEIANRTLEIGRSYSGLTDHGVVAGHLEFDKAMRKRGINPVFGAELYAGINFNNLKKGERDQAHLIALAMTDEGLKNLWRLVNATADRDHFHHVGRVSQEDIVKYKEGIIFTSACPLGLVPKGLLRGDDTHLNWYLDNLGDNFRIEITTYPGDAEFKDMDSEGEEATVTPRLINELLITAADERGVPVTYGDDGHYAFPKDFEKHDMYLAAQTRQSIYTPVEERKMYHPPNAMCIKDEKMVREAFHYLPKKKVDEVIANTHAVGEAADAHLPTVDRPHLPVFIPTECPWIDSEDKRDATALFTDLVGEGIDRIYSGTEREEEAWTKATHEVEVLTEDGLEHYFLMAWDIMQFCKLEEINVGPGRGSSAGAIVAYALGITDVDPLYYDLYFERFWNKGRTDGFPDIDTDFAKSRRSEILDYLIARWGADRVCSIGSVTHMKPIAVIEKLATACEIDHGEVEQLKKIVKQTKDLEIHGHEQIGWNPEIEPDKVIYVNTSTEMNPEGDKVGKEIEQWIGDNEKRQKYVEMCEAACSRNSNYGVHASGIVVSDIDLAAYAPAYLRGGKAEGIPATMFPMKEIEKLKLVKEDVLGLKTLDTLAEWDKLMEEKGITTEWSGLDRQEHSEEMWKLLDEGFVAGIFQCETHAGKDLAERLKIRNVEDLGVLVALNRPGPSRAGVPNRYIARKEGRSEITYPHPLLEEILKPTFALFLYQEQIIRFMSELGYSLGDADAMRKILGKKQPEKLSEIFEGFNEWDKKGFLQVAMEKGFSKEVATEVWKDIEGFASYSFNKSHSIAYAIIAFRCLYAKFYGPQEWYIACIRTVDNAKRVDLTPQYIKEARRMGIKVLPPDIRYSKAEVDVHDGHIYFGFGDIKGVGTGGEYLVKLRDENRFDISTPEILEEMLVCLNDMELAHKKEAIAEDNPLPSDWKSPKQLLNEKKLSLVHAVGAWNDLEGATIDLKTQQKCELELLNVILTDNTEEILEQHQEEIEKCDSWDDAVLAWEDKETDEEQTHQDYRLPAIITGIKPTKVKASGNAMGIVTMEYGRHELTFACFSNKWVANKFLFKPHNVGIFTIRQSAPTDKRSSGYHFEQGRLLS